MGGAQEANITSYLQAQNYRWYGFWVDMPAIIPAVITIILSTLGLVAYCGLQWVRSKTNTLRKNSPVLTKLVVYPLKSCAGVSVQSWESNEFGLKHDREWMVVDTTEGTTPLTFVTQRECPGLATIGVALTPTTLRLTHPAAKSPLELSLKVPDLNDPWTHVVKAKVWDDLCTAIDLGDQASAWLQEALVGCKYLGDKGPENFRLVRFSPSCERVVAPKYTPMGQEALTAFADGFPFLLISQTSVDEVDRLVKEKGREPVGNTRFRPNMIVDSGDRALPPFADDRWKRAILQDDEGGDSIELLFTKPCARCNIITQDQKTGARDKKGEPHATLCKFRQGRHLGFKEKWKKEVFFGQNVLASPMGAKYTVGMRLHVLERHEEWPESWTKDDPEDAQSSAP